jgi:hypothetical protein
MAFAVGCRNRSFVFPSGFGITAPPQGGSPINLPRFNLIAT